MEVSLCKRDLDRQYQLAMDGRLYMLEIPGQQRSGFQKVHC